MNQSTLHIERTTVQTDQPILIIHTRGNLDGSNLVVVK
jgi:hypothetical protein